MNQPDDVDPSPDRDWSGEERAAAARGMQTEKPRGAGRAMVLGIVGLVGGGITTAAELFLLMLGKQQQVQHDDGAGCLAVLMAGPLLFGGYCFGGLFVAVSAAALVSSLNTKSRSARVVSALALVLSLAALGLTGFISYDMSNWFEGARW